MRVTKIWKKKKGRRDDLLVPYKGLGREGGNTPEELQHASSDR
jgi:hypothetical protein